MTADSAQVVGIVKVGEMDTALKGKDRAAVLEYLNAEVRRYQQTHNTSEMRALFLGTGESGKSTVFKQMRLFYDGDFMASDRAHFSKIIWAEMLRSMRLVLDSLSDDIRLNPTLAINVQLLRWKKLLQSQNLTYENLIRQEQSGAAKKFLWHHAQQATRKPLPPSPSTPVQRGFNYDKLSRAAEQAQSTARRGVRLEELIEEHVRVVQIAPEPENVVADRRTLATAVSELWEKSPVIRQLVENPINNLRIDANTAYFFRKAMELGDPAYLATNDDILKARVKTTGVHTSTFKFRGNALTVIDVGGQRAERRKWVHCFDDATCILFVASTGDYDVTTIDTESNAPKNALKDSLAIFQKLMESKWLYDKPVCLLLNKMDVLENKLPLSSFAAHFPEFAGNPLNKDDVCSFIEKEFRRRAPIPPSKFYTYRTCATDTKTMHFVVQAVTDMIFVDNLATAGLI